MAFQQEAIKFIAVAGLATLRAANVVSFPSIAIVSTLVIVQGFTLLSVAAPPINKKVQEPSVAFADTLRGAVAHSSPAQRVAFCVPVAFAVARALKWCGASPSQLLVLGLCLGGLLCAVMKPIQQGQGAVAKTAPCSLYASSFWPELEKSPEQAENPLAELAAKCNSPPCLMTDLVGQFEVELPSPKLMVLEEFEEFEM